MKNDLSYLPLHLFDCQHLVTLNLDNNRLKTLPRQFQHLSNLSELSVCGNDLVVIPQSM